MQRYEIIDDIGGGGMGRVRLARHVDGRLVVMKTAIHEDDDERLRDEARVGLRLHHEGIVQTLELLELADRTGKARPVLVTAYVPGISLLELRGHGPLPPLVVCRLGQELALALAALHAACDDHGRPLSVVHRDVTGANCLLGHDGRARLIDLGIARSRENRALRTETGLLRGTLRYLAPELFEQGSYSPQSDVWSLGVVLWEALLGRSAIVGSDAVAINRIASGLVMVCDDGEEPDPVLARAIGHLLALEPQDRPPTAADAAAIFATVERDLTGGDAGIATTASAMVVRLALVGGEHDDDPLKETVRQASRVFGRRKETASAMAMSPPPVGPEDPRPIALWPTPTPTPTPTPWDVGSAPAIPDAPVRLRAYTESLLQMEQKAIAAAERHEKRAVAEQQAAEHQAAAKLQAMRTGAAKAAPAPGAVDPFDLDGATVMLEIPNSLGGHE